ncbi:transglycosylase SLT domain-containing protein [Myxosarcina sp. GI1]|uniref:transglycosylase SLT domain-containing protein n=1 Tax=Myxosarcina sp. GI1 TaxID=1541065 RepID=UPI0005613A27|nr:transglycosylase SLT domain-containing protein [Myxosarcina sp. GI1]
MLKPKMHLKIWQKLQTASTLSLISSGLLIAILGSLGWLAIQDGRLLPIGKFALERQARKASSLTTLRSLPPQQRAAELKELATETKTNDRYRARYLLATDLLQQQQGAAAIEYLQGLETDYPLLAPQILLKLAQAYRQDGREAEFRQTIERLRENYPNSPAIADALYLLNPQDRQIQQELISKFPYHPRTIELARQLLKQNPNRFELLLLLAKYARGDNLDPIRDRLVLQHPARLEPEDWEAIADGYWQAGENRKAADAYTFAPETPRNLYRTARGFHLNGNIDLARNAYKQTIEEYYDSREAGWSLLYLASITGGDEAIVYLEKAIANFPEVAPQALLAKAIIHDAFDKDRAAKAARQELLNTYANSDTAAEYRWQIAWQLASEGKKREAVRVMQPVANFTFSLDSAPKALFWSAKWAKELGDSQEAKHLWHRVIALYPQSYWAWRSAVHLGWDVGDFSNLRNLSPDLKLNPSYIPLPMGSEALQELYLLGQTRDAWTLLQAEIERASQLSVAEQFTESLLQLELGQIATGIEQILALREREEPQERQEWQALRQTAAYWYGLFPFAYQQQILQAARQEAINPLLVIAVMRKESTFNPQVSSKVGAVGLMQIVPPTAQWVAEQTNLSDYSLTNSTDNINIGTWYLAYNHQRYNNSSLLAIASYNAGTGNVSQWLQNYDIADRDRFIEQIPFPETQDYVEGVFGNYWNYLRLYSPQIKDRINRDRQANWMAK